MSASVRFNSSKYGNHRTEHAGRTYASKAEARRAMELQLMQAAGEIAGLEYQPSWTLCRKPLVRYTADFRYLDRDGHQVFEDVKGVLTRDQRTKLAWVREKFGVEVRLVRE